MKKKFVLYLFIISSAFIEAQSYIGFLTDNYSGVHSVISNPANIVDSRFKTDINLAGASFFVSNDYMGVNIMDATKPGYIVEDDSKFSPKTDNNAALNLDVLGPSFMLNITPNSSVALFTRARTFLNASNINGKGVELMFDEPDAYFINAGNTGVIAQAWAELGLSYARILKDNGIHFLKGGMSLKYLQGVANAYVYGRDVTIDWDKNAIPGSTLGYFDTKGEAVVGAFDHGIFYDDYKVDNYKLPNSNGFGLDLGFVYEWRPNYKEYVKSNAKGESIVLKDKNKYKLKLGVAITDLGSIKYNGSEKEDDEIGRQDIYNISINDIEGDAFQSDLDIVDAVQDVYNSMVSTYGYKTYLPTALHLNADWSINKYFYLNLNSDLSLRKAVKERASSVANLITLTPRYETKWFSFFVPVSTVYGNFMVGSGFRLGSLYIGSGSVVTALTGNNVRTADAYAGLKLPIYQPRIKDNDGDGVYNKVDLCPEEAGPVENNGCPWGDEDKDSVLDNEDKCPKEAGPVENNGCPWGDADKDTVLDNVDKCVDVVGPVENFGCPWGDLDKDTILDNVDKCVDVAGPVENNGCPWGDLDKDTVLDNVDKCVDVAGPVENNGCPWLDTDGDKVLDKDDQCIKIPGPVSNNGCPEVTVDVQKTLNEYAKTILFNTGKATIKEESTLVLKDIVKILNEYPTAKFLIEGHTDNVGGAARNQILSEERANSVMLFLVNNGISAERLKAKGFGLTKPIADNKTATGRTLNRRVEINLVK